MACGTGKTLVTRWITEAREDRLVLVLVPTLLLLKQFRTQWREQASARLHRPRRLLRCRHDGQGRVDRPSRRARRPRHHRPRRHRHLPQGRRTAVSSSARMPPRPASPRPRRTPRCPPSTSSSPTRPTGWRASPAGATRSERDTRVVLDGDAHPGQATAVRHGHATRLRAGQPRRAREPRGHRVRLDGRCRALRRRGPPALVPRAVELGRLVDYRLSVVVVTDAEVQRLSP